MAVERCWCQHDEASHREGRCEGCIPDGLLDPVHKFWPIAYLPPKRLPQTPRRHRTPAHEPQARSARP